MCDNSFYFAFVVARSREHHTFVSMESAIGELVWHNVMPEVRRGHSRCRTELLQGTHIAQLEMPKKRSPSDLHEEKRTDTSIRRDLIAARSLLRCSSARFIVSWSMCWNAVRHESRLPRERTAAKCLCRIRASVQDVFPGFDTVVSGDSKAQMWQARGVLHGGARVVHEREPDGRTGTRGPVAAVDMPVPLWSLQDAPTWTRYEVGAVIASAVETVTL